MKRLRMMNCNCKRRPCEHVGYTWQIRALTWLGVPSGLTLIRQLRSSLEMYS